MGNNRDLIPKSEWQVKAGFKQDKARKTQRRIEEGFLPPATAATTNEGVPTIQEECEEPSAGANLPQEPAIETQQERDRESETPRQQEEAEVQQESDVRRSRRARRPPVRAADYVPHDHIAFEAIAEPEGVIDSEWDELHPLLSMKATSDPDTMYLWEAMKQPDFEQFKKAMENEIADHVRLGNWEIVLCTEVPEGCAILPAVWSMKRKRRIATREVYKHKARLNIDGSKQVYGLHYNETYAPVVTWAATRFFLIMSILNNWHTRQLDFILAYTQAKVERDIYMEIPKGVIIEEEDGTTASKGKYVLKLINNLYGQKQAGRVWNQHLVKHLKGLGFVQSDVDECVFYFQRSVFLVYTDDTILMGPDKSEIEHIIQLLQSVFKVQDEGDLSDYLGIKISKLKDGKILLTQPHLIDSIIHDLGLDKPDTKSRATPALSSGHV
jgi:hypothetical protein